MTFAESIQTCLSKYADFTGRARRSEYWWFVLFALIASAVASRLGTLIYLVVVLGLFLPQIAAGVRRLHDTGRSGFYYFIVLIPLVGGILLIVWMATEGDPGENEYGLAPM